VSLFVEPENELTNPKTRRFLDMEDEIEEIGFLEEIEIHHDAEDVKTVQFIGRVAKSSRVQ
jgi:hypothetical protein